MSTLSGAQSAEALWQPARSELETSTLLNESTVPFSSEAAPPSWIPAAAYNWLSFFRGLTLAAGAAASGAVAGAGLALLLFLVVTASLAPASDTFSRQLSLDYSAADLVAEAVFLPEAQLGDGLLPDNPQRDARFLAPQQAVDVWVELEVPRDTAQGVAQVVAQLSSLDGRVAAKASRALMMRTDWWSLSSLSLAPLRWLGVLDGTRTVRVPLFRAYREKREVPFMAARVAIKTRNPTWAAEVVTATLKVRLRLGLVGRAIYALRPGPLGLLLLGCTAAAALLGGGTAALLFLALLLYAGFGGGGKAAEAAEEVSSSFDEVEVSSVSGVSEASSSLLRELEEEEGEPPSPAPLPAMPAAASVGRLWRGLAAEAGSSSMAGTQQRPAARKPAAAGPADSAMGSEEVGWWASALRRRTAAKPAPSS